MVDVSGNRYQIDTMKTLIILISVILGYIHTATIPPGFCTPNDIVLVIDGSNSVGTENFNILKSQMVDFIRQLPVTEEGIRVGVVLYSTTIEPQYIIPMTGNEASLTTSIFGLPYPGQGTLTNLGIDRGIQMLTQEGRPGVGKKLVVITDGYSNLPAATNSSAQAAAVTGYDRYALGVGNGVYDPELQVIASAPENVRKATDFNVVFDALRLFSREICDSLTTTATPTLPPSNCAADIVFILDSSGIAGIDNLYTGYHSAIKSFISQRPLSDTGIRVGAVITSDSQTIEIPLSSDGVSLTNQLNVYPTQFGGGLLLSQGLNGAMNVFNGDSLNRNAPRVTVVLSTTRSNGGIIPSNEANALKNLAGGGPMSVITLGIDSPFGPLYTAEELGAVASSSSDVYLGETISNLQTRFNNIAAAECQIIVPTSPPIPTLAPGCAADMVFIVDSSDLSTFGNSYSEMVTSIRDYVASQNLNDNGLRVGVVFTNDVQTVKIPLSSDKNQLTSQIDSYVNNPLSGGLQLSGGINGAIELFNTDPLNRYAPQITVALSVAQSSNGIATTEANNLKTLTGGPSMSVHTFGVVSPMDVALYSVDELSTIADPGKFTPGIKPGSLLQNYVCIASGECGQIIIPPTLPPPTTASNCAADIVFVIDSSSLSGFGDNPVYNDAWNAVNTFINQQSLSNTGYRVGVVFASETTTVPIPLTADKATLQSQLQGFPTAFQDNTNLGEGLNAAANVFSSDTLNRNAPRVTIVVSAGQSINGFPVVQAENLKNLPGKPVDVYAVGVPIAFGPFYNTGELDVIATNNNVIELTNGEALKQTFETIASTECEQFVPPTEPPPPECAADIVFVVDSSGISSFEDNYDDALAAINTFLDTQTLSNNHLRVGTVFTSGGMTVPTPLTADKMLLKNQLAGFTTPFGGATTLNDGLNAAAGIFSSDASNRNAPRVTIVITSGQTNAGVPVTEAANLQNLPGYPMEVYAIGSGLSFGNLYSLVELNTIATGSNVIQTSDTKTLAQTLNGIAAAECQPLQTITTTESPPMPVTDCAADIVFVVDASDITNSDNLWNDMKNTIQTFVNQPFISDSGTRVGIVFTNASTTNTIAISGDKTNIGNQMNMYPTPLGGGQQLGTGLNAATTLFNSDPYNRNAPKVAIVLTAARSQGGTIPVNEANTLKASNGGVSTYAIGIDNLNGQFYNPSELDAIASSPVQSLRVSDRNTLLSTLNSINSDECRIREIPANCNPTDIVLVVDGSSSIGPFAFNDLKATLVQFTRDIPASPNGVNIGVVTYSSSVNPFDNIRLTGDLNTLQTDILNLPYPEQGTRTDLGIEEGRIMLANGRPGVKKVMVVITDGFSDIPTLTSSQAQISRDVDNIDMYALGVGNGVDDAELLSIAGYIGNVEKVDNFQSIIPSFLQLSRAICIVPTTPPPPTTPSPPPPACAADMVIVVDSSDITKSGNIYNETLDALRDFVNQQAISDNGNRIGIVFTNDGIPTKIPISGDKNYLLNAINNNPDPLGGGLILGNGLNGAADLFNNDAQSRNVPRVTAVISVGATRGFMLPLFEANTLKGLQGGAPMAVYAAGVQSPNGNLYNPNELSLIATSNNNVQQLSSARNILPFLNNVQSAECELVPDLKSCNPRDIVLVVDGSQSIGSASFDLLKSKLIDFTRQVSMGPLETNVGVVVYSSDVQQSGIIPLTGDPATIEAAINALPYPEAGTNTHLGMIEGNNLLSASTRSGVDKVMVVITDGYSDDPASTYNVANNLKTGNGVTVYSIGVGNGVNDAELYDIASNAGNVQKVTGFDAITVPFARVARAICPTPCPVDVVFVVDSSDFTNSGQVYEGFIESIKSFVRQQSISNIGTRVGVVFTNDNAADTIQIPLSGDSNNIMNALDGNPNPLGDGLFLGNGLDGAANLFITDSLNRNAHRLAFVLTAGRSKGGVIPTAQAQNLKNLPVTVSSFGVPTTAGVLYSINELRTISSTPFANVFPQNDMSSLPIIFDSLVEDTCAGGPPPPIVTPAPTTPIPACNPRDIVLVVDGSASIGPANFDILKNNLLNFVQQLPITPNDANVGVVLYSSGINAGNTIALTGDSPSLQNAILNLPYPEAGTRTDLGIDAGLTMLQNGRPGEDKIMIVITDGVSDFPDATKIAAQNAKNDGVTVFAVGVGGVDPTELNEIASGPTYVQTASDFNSLAQSLLLLSRSLCDPVPTTPAPDCVNPLDVVFVVDGSGSVGSTNFDLMVNRIADAMPRFDLDPAIVNVGLIVFDSDIRATIDMSSDSNQLQTDIRALSHPGGSTDAGKGIDAAQLMLQTQGRPGVPNVMVVLADGVSSPSPLPNADAAKAAGTDIHTIGIGPGADMTELTAVASDPTKAKKADTFDVIQLTLDDLVNDLC